MRNLKLIFNKKNNFIYIIIALILMLIPVFTAYIFKVYGYKVGTFPLIFCLAIIFIYSVLKSPKFAVLALMFMAYFIMFIITLITTSFPLGTIMDGMLALLILGFFIQQKYYKNFKLFKNPISYVILVWILYNLIQVFNPEAASQLAWVYTIRTVAVVMLSYYIFTYYIDSVKFIRIIIIFWLILSFFAALYAIKQEYFGFFNFETKNHYDPLTYALLFIDGHWRKNSIFSDPVAFSYNMAVSALLCLGLLTGPFKLRYKLILAALLVLFITVMPYSGTRASYVLIPAAGFLFVAIKLDKYIIMLSVVFGLCFLVLINLPTQNSTMSRFQSAFKPNDDASYSVRKENQKKVQPFIQSHPMGGGLGGSGAWGVRFAPNSFLAQFPPDSGYLRTGMELGWIGLFIICTLFFTSLFVGIKNYFSMHDLELKAYCFSMVLIVFAVAIANFPQEAIVQYPLNIFFYLFLALITVTKVLDDQKYNEEQGIKEKKIKGM